MKKPPVGNPEKYVPQLPWNSDRSYLKTDDGYYASILTDPQPLGLGLKWRMTKPRPHGLVEHLNGSTNSHASAIKLVEFLIIEDRKIVANAPALAALYAETAEACHG